jgi:hypothetical protein
MNIRFHSVIVIKLEFRGSILKMAALSHTHLHETFRQIQLHKWGLPLSLTHSPLNFVQMHSEIGSKIFSSTEFVPMTSAKKEALD